MRTSKMNDTYEMGYLESIGHNLPADVANSGRGTPIDTISLGSTSGNSSIGQFFVSLGDAAKSVLNSPAVQRIVDSALVNDPTVNVPKATPPSTATSSISPVIKWGIFAGVAILATVLIVKLVRR
jgi:hypothetical protein